MTENLKRCPFCGGEAKCIEFYGLYHVICCNCYIAGKDCSTRESAVSAWNARPIEDELTGKIEKLERENHILRLDLAEIARGFDVDGFDYTREGMMRIAKEALKGESK